MNREEVNFQGVVTPVTLMLPVSGIATQYQLEIQKLLTEDSDRIMQSAYANAAAYVKAEYPALPNAEDILRAKNIIVWRKIKWGVLFDLKGEDEYQVAVVFQGDKIEVGPHDILL